jgi:hypothetical protein
MRAAMVAYKSAPKVAHPLLLEFFAVCQRPNPTEIRYLAQQTAITPMVVAAWCKTENQLDGYGTC